MYIGFFYSKLFQILVPFRSASLTCKRAGVFQSTEPSIQVLRHQDAAAAFHQTGDIECVTQADLAGGGFVHGYLGRPIKIVESAQGQAPDLYRRFLLTRNDM